MTPAGRQQDESGRVRSPADEHATPIEGFLDRSSILFRRTIVGVIIVVLLLAGISIALAWRQYDDAKSRALTDLDARVVAVSAIVDAYFGGQIATLDSIAKAPAVVGEKSTQMSAYFRRVQPPGGKLFNGGLGWIDRNGMVRASSSPGGPRSLNLSRRGYFRQVLATGRPYVSAGLIGLRVKQPIIVIAVPTHDPAGRVSGVLGGSILLKTVGESKQSLALGYGGLQVIDRDGHLLLGGLAAVQNRALLARILRTPSGVLASSPGLDGKGNDAIVYSTSKVSNWVVVIDRSRSALFAPAWRSLLLELASLGAALLLAFGILTFLVRRSRRETEAQDGRARSWSELTRALGSATTQAEVADALLGSLVAAFGSGVAIVAFDSDGETQFKAAYRLAQARQIVESRETLERIAQHARRGPGTWLLDREPALREVIALPGRRLRALHGVPILDRHEWLLGTISLLLPTSSFEASEWALLESFAELAAQALQRALLFEREHDLADRLQRSLLPDRLPSAAGVELAGHYHAGGTAVEVGGDWYDAVRRPDGIIQLCVGDVSGRGIGPATVMGRQRNTFHVFAYDYLSPAEIIRRMMRHGSADEMITVACVSLDPYTGELRYSCAGHPPPLLLDRESGEVVRLDLAGAPPIGVAEPADILEAQVQVSDHVALALYTDGLIERRGANIEDGIDLLGRVIAEGSAVTPDAVLAKISAAIGAPDDDVALLLVSFDGERTGFELEVPGEPASLSSIRGRLRAWLARRHVDDAEAADIVLAVAEACNNAIEHGYRDRDGTIKVSARQEGEALSVVVEDQGSWRPEEPNDERGRGIMLMRLLMHTAEIERGEHGTRVTLERRVLRDREEVGYAGSTPRA